MDNSTKEIPSAEECKMAAANVLDSYAQFVRCILILLNICAFAQIFLILSGYRKRRVPLHGNLRLLYGNIVIMSTLVGPAGFLMIELNNVFLSIFYWSEPCQMLCSLWYVILSKVTAYAFTIGLPLLHFSVMVERVRATLLVQHYEVEGTVFSIANLLSIYGIIFLYVLYLSYTVLLEHDFNFAKKVPANIFTNKYNGTVLIILFYAQLGIVFFTALGDYLVVRINIRRKTENKRFDSNGEGGKLVKYSLSANYQLQENLRTMRLIFPLDLAYFVCSTMFTLLAVLLRTLYSQGLLAITPFMANYNWLCCLMTSYSILALFYYRKFLVNREKGHRHKFGRKGTNEICPAHSSEMCTDGNLTMEIHFDQLRKQWNL